MFYEFVIPVVEEYGENCKLDENNIKDIYFRINCNSLDDCDITEYLEKHYSNEEILQWNDEYINRKIDECYQLLPYSDWESISRIGTNICKFCRVFTYQKSTYERMIEFLKKFYCTYGYFMNYDFNKMRSDCSGELDKTFFPFMYIYIHKHFDLSNLELHARSTGAEWRYLEDDGYFGMIPRFYKLGYQDLLNRMLIELIVPIFEHFYEENALMEKLDIQYSECGEKNIKDWAFREVIADYIKLHRIPVPEEFKKYL